MTGKLTFLSWFRFHRVSRFFPFVLILLIAVSGFFQGCDDDGPVGPADPTATPIPTTTPDPTVPPEPTATPMYSGSWCGSTWSEDSPYCFEGSISFQVMEGTTFGNAFVCVTPWYDNHYSLNYNLAFEASIVDNGFVVSYFDGSYNGGYRRWTIAGFFDSHAHIIGTWSYDSLGPFGEGGEDGYGGWSATPN